MNVLLKFPAYATDPGQFQAAVASLRMEQVALPEVARMLGVRFPSDAVSVEDAVSRSGTSWDRFACLVGVSPNKIRQVCARRNVLNEFERSQVRNLLGAELPWAVERKPWADLLKEQQGKPPRAILEAAGYALVDAPTLKEALAASGIPGVRFAQVLGVSQPQVYQWANGLAGMTPRHLAAVQSVFPSVRNTRETARDRMPDNPWALAFARAGVTQVQVARALGVTTPLVNHWCTGRSKPAEHHLPQLRALVGGALPTPPPSDLDILLDWLGDKGLLDEAVAYMEARRG